MFFKKNNVFLLLGTLLCGQMYGMEQRDLIMIIDDNMVPGLEARDATSNRHYASTSH